MMNEQQFMQFLQEYPEIIPYIQEDDELLAEIVLNPQFREEVVREVAEMRGESTSQDYAQQVYAQQQAQQTQAPPSPYTPAQRDQQGNWDFSQNKDVFSPEVRSMQGGEAGTVGYNQAVDNPWGRSQETQFTWKPQFEVKSPSGQTYLVGEEQAKTMFRHMVQGGYASPQDFDQFVRPTGNTMKSFDLENTNKIYANDQQKFQWMNEQYAKDPEAEMLRRAQQSDDYHRSQDYKNTGKQTAVDTYTQREWDRLWREKDRQTTNINNFVAQQQANPARMPAQPAQPKQYQYENFDANGKSMGFTTGASGQSNYMQGAHSVKAPNGKIYQTSHATNIKSEPPITTSTNLNNFRQPNQASTGVTSATANPAVNKAPTKVATASSHIPSSLQAYMSSTGNGRAMPVPTQPKPNVSASASKVSNSISSIRDRLLSSLRK